MNLVSRILLVLFILLSVSALVFAGSPACGCMDTSAKCDSRPDCHWTNGRCYGAIDAPIYYMYDSNGNLVCDGSKCYQYNGANQLENVTNCVGTIIAQYWYDYTGRKIQAIEDGVTIYYPFPGFESRVNGSQLENTTYIYANGEIVARKDPNGSMHYYHGDQLGSTSVITDASGTLEEKTKYLPFGGNRSGGTKTKYLFNGKELASITGLYDYLARWYNPLTMHFITPDGLISDPYDPQTFNRYSYVQNNPVRYTDSTGHVVDEFMDAGFIMMDLGELYKDPGNPWNWGALGADVACASVPIITGGGKAVKAVESGEAARYSDEAIENAGRGLEYLDRSLDIASKGGDLLNTVRSEKIGGKVFWIEKGTKETHGLEHIMAHSNDYQKVFGSTVSETQIMESTMNTIKNAEKVVDVGKGKFNYYTRITVDGKEVTMLTVANTEGKVITSYPVKMDSASRYEAVWGSSKPANAWGG